MEAEHVSQDRGSLRRVVEQQRHTLEAAYRMFRGDVSIAPALLSLSAGYANQAKRHAVGIAEGKDLLAKALLERLMRDDFFNQALGPVSERAQRHAEGGLIGFADAAAARRRSHPRKKREDRARAAGLIAVVEVIGRRVVEIDRSLDEAQAEVARIEIEVLERIAGDCRHMMDTWHGVASWIRAASGTLPPNFGPTDN